MTIYLFIEGILIGLVVAVPVGPLGLLCINRALMLGPQCGFFYGGGVATAEAQAAGIAALSISLISGLFVEHQLALRLVGGIFLCFLGCKIYRSEPASQAPVNNVNGLLSAYVTTFLLAFSNPLTILSFVAIYAGWHVPSLDGRYVAAVTLTGGVFTGSALWWVGLFIALTTFHNKLNLRFLLWVHRVSGAIIAGFGVVVLLSLTPLTQVVGVQF